MKRFLPLLASLVALVALLASAEGEPAQAASRVAAARRPTLELHQTDALGRHFWRPAGSQARPPAADLGGRFWHPERRGVGRP